MKVFFTLAVLLCASEIALAQSNTTAPTPTPAKLEELSKLLNDPEIQSWLAAQRTQSPQAPVSESSSAAMVLAQRIKGHINRIEAAIPLLPSEAANARLKIETEINGRGPLAVLLLFLALIAFGFGAEWLFRKLAADISKRHAAHAHLVPSHHLHHIGRTMFAQFAPLVAFSLASVGIFLAFTWPQLLSGLMLHLLLAFIVCRFVMRLLAILLAPDSRAASSIGEAPARLIPMPDENAAFWYKRLSIFAAVFFTGWAVVRIMAVLGITPAVASIVGYAMGLGLLASAIEIAWNRPAKHENVVKTNTWAWVLTFFFCGLWLLWVTGLNGLLWLGIYAVILPGILRSTSAAMKAVFQKMNPDQSGRTVLEVLTERGMRALIIIAAVIWLGAILQFEPNSLMQDASANRITRGALGGVIILLVADMIWQVVKAFINRRLEQARLDGGDEAELAKSGRLLTLLPMLRLALAGLIGTIAVMMVLSGLGVEVGPLIAGAGIFGVAIGFGSQTLVKDIISGIFYMMDDAFRVGEYIQSGSYKGTVESFSIRSVKLRHHRGPIFTVPFGVLGAVQNMSRD